jgi:hypothetical protein
MVPMPVSVTDANPDGADSDYDGVRDHRWLVADARRAGKCRHRQQLNNEKGKQSILHDILLGIYLFGV